MRERCAIEHDWVELVFYVSRGGYREETTKTWCGISRALLLVGYETATAILESTQRPGHSASVGFCVSGAILHLPHTIVESMRWAIISKALNRPELEY
jgi:hypothetical protein